MKVGYTTPQSQLALMKIKWDLEDVDGWSSQTYPIDKLVQGFETHLYHIIADEISLNNFKDFLKLCGLLDFGEKTQFYKSTFLFLTQFYFKFFPSSPPESIKQSLIEIKRTMYIYHIARLTHRDIHRLTPLSHFGDYEENFKSCITPPHIVGEEIVDKCITQYLVTKYSIKINEDIVTILNYLKNGVKFSMLLSPYFDKIEIVGIVLALKSYNQAL